jgi:hypothetical protein
MWSRAIGLANLQRVAIIGLHRIPPAVRAVGADDPDLTPLPGVV